jgi:hypothetical protein
VVRRCVRSRNLVNEEALAHWGGLLRKIQKKNTLVTNVVISVGLSCMEEHMKAHKLVCGMNVLKLRHQNAKNASRALCSVA